MRFYHDCKIFIGPLLQRLRQQDHELFVVCFSYRNTLDAISLPYSLKSVRSDHLRWITTICSVRIVHPSATSPLQTKLRLNPSLIIPRPCVIPGGDRSRRFIESGKRERPADREAIFAPKPGQSCRGRSLVAMPEGAAETGKPVFTTARALLTKTRPLSAGRSTRQEGEHEDSRRDRQSLSRRAVRGTAIPFTDGSS
jgi:hypothetical protein